MNESTLEAHQQDVTDDTILVLGATGTTGAEVTSQLIAAGHRPRLLVRNPAKVTGFEGRAVIVEGSIENHVDLARALDGIQRMYLVSSELAGPSLEVTAIDAAKAAGVRHVVKLSVITADSPIITFARWHAGTERHLIESGMAWTMLRPTNFTSNALMQWAASIRAQGAIHQPTGTGRWAAVDPADIGAVAAQALTAPGHEGQSYTLTGPEALDAAGYAAVLSSVLGREVEFVDMPLEAFRDQVLSFGLPPEYAEASLELITMMRNGNWDMVSLDIESVLGRKATTFETWARRHASAFEPAEA